MPPVSLCAAYGSAEEFLAAFDAEISRHGLLVRGSSFPHATAMQECTLIVVVGEEEPLDVPARVAAVTPGLGVAVMFEGVPPALAALAQRFRPAPAPAEEEEPAAASPSPEPEPEAAEAPEPVGPLTERLKAMTVQQKMQLGLAGSREERTALLRDTNRSIHVYVLKNPRIGLDEVQYAAKQPGLSPDALKMIAEHREWSMSSTVCSALVRNPKVPVALALRLLDRVPLTELRAIAKGGARDQVVHAARKKVAG